MLQFNLAINAEVALKGFKHDKGELESRGFPQLKRNPTYLHKLRNHIYDKLVKSKEPLKLLKNPKKLVAGFKFDKLNIEEFKTVVRKTSAECTDPQFVFIWDKLPFGFSDLWLDKQGELTIDKNAFDKKAYLKEVEKYGEEFKV